MYRRPSRPRTQIRMRITTSELSRSRPALDAPSHPGARRGRRRLPSSPTRGRTQFSCRFLWDADFGRREGSRQIAHVSLRASISSGLDRNILCGERAPPLRAFRSFYGQLLIYHLIHGPAKTQVLIPSGFAWGVADLIKHRAAKSNQRARRLRQKHCRPDASMARRSSTSRPVAQTSQRAANLSNYCLRPRERRPVPPNQGRGGRSPAATTSRMNATLEIRDAR